MKRPWLWFGICSAAHFCVSAASFLWGYALSSSHMDGHRVSHLSAVLASLLVRITEFPLTASLARVLPLPGVFGWLPILANSLLCSALLVAAIHSVRSRSMRITQPDRLRSTITR